MAESARGAPARVPAARPVEYFARCDDCRQWRRVPYEEVDKITSSDKWHCAQNSDPAFQSCHVPQDVTAAEVRAMLARHHPGLEALSPPDPDKYQRIAEHRPHTASLLPQEDCVPICACSRAGNASCDPATCSNALLRVECFRGGPAAPCWQTGEERCRNHRVLAKAPVAVRVGRGGPKGFGLFCTSPTPAGAFVMRVEGDPITPDQALQEMLRSAAQGERHLYLFRLGPSGFLDCRARGNEGRFLNHSCDPNCELQAWRADGCLVLCLFAIRDIAPGEELTVDYGIEGYGLKAFPCLCLSSRCRGFVGARGEKLPDKAELQAREDCSAWPEPQAVDPIAVAAPAAVATAPVTPPPDPGTMSRGRGPQGRPVAESLADELARAGAGDAGPYSPGGAASPRVSGAGRSALAEALAAESQASSPVRQLFSAGSASGFAPGIVPAINAPGHSPRTPHRAGATAEIHPNGDQGQADGADDSMPEVPNVDLGPSFIAEFGGGVRVDSGEGDDPTATDTVVTGAAAPSAQEGPALKKPGLLRRLFARSRSPTPPRKRPGSQSGPSEGAGTAGKEGRTGGAGRTKALPATGQGGARDAGGVSNPQGPAEASSPPARDSSRPKSRGRLGCGLRAETASMDQDPHQVHPSSKHGLVGRSGVPVPGSKGPTTPGPTQAPSRPRAASAPRHRSPIAGCLGILPRSESHTAARRGPMALPRVLQRPQPEDPMPLGALGPGRCVAVLRPPLPWVARGAAPTPDAWRELLWAAGACDAGRPRWGDGAGGALGRSPEGPPSDQASACDYLCDVLDAASTLLAAYASRAVPVPASVDRATLARLFAQQATAALRRISGSDAASTAPLARATHAMLGVLERCAVLAGGPREGWALLTGARLTQGHVVLSAGTHLAEVARCEGDASVARRARRLLAACTDGTPLDFVSLEGPPEPHAGAHGAPWRADDGPATPPRGQVRGTGAFGTEEGPLHRDHDLPSPDLHPPLPSASPGALPPAPDRSHAGPHSPFGSPQSPAPHPRRRTGKTAIGDGQRGAVRGAVGASDSDVLPLMRSLDAHVGSIAESMRGDASLGLRRRLDEAILAVARSIEGLAAAQQHAQPAGAPHGPAGSPGRSTGRGMPEAGTPRTQQGTAGPGIGAKQGPVTARLVADGGDPGGVASVGRTPPVSCAPMSGAGQLPGTMPVPYSGLGTRGGEDLMGTVGMEATAAHSLRARELAGRARAELGQRLESKARLLAALAADAPPVGATDRDDPASLPDLIRTAVAADSGDWGPGRRGGGGVRASQPSAVLADVSAVGASADGRLGESSGQAADAAFDGAPSGTPQGPQLPMEVSEETEDAPLVADSEHRSGSSGVGELDDTGDTTQGQRDTGEGAQGLGTRQGVPAALHTRAGAEASLRRFLSRFLGVPLLARGSGDALRDSVGQGPSAREGWGAGQDGAAALWPGYVAPVDARDRGLAEGLAMLRARARLVDGSPDVAAIAEVLGDSESDVSREMRREAARLRHRERRRRLRKEWEGEGRGPQDSDAHDVQDSIRYDPGIPLLRAGKGHSAGESWMEGRPAASGPGALRLPSTVLAPTPATRPRALLLTHQDIARLETGAYPARRDAPMVRHRGVSGSDGASEAHVRPTHGREGSSPASVTSSEGTRAAAGRGPRGVERLWPGAGRGAAGSEHSTGVGAFDSEAGRARGAPSQRQGNNGAHGTATDLSPDDAFWLDSLLALAGGATGDGHSAPAEARPAGVAENGRSSVAREALAAGAGPLLDEPTRHLAGAMDRLGLVLQGVMRHAAAAAPAPAPAAATPAPARGEGRGRASRRVEGSPGEGGRTPRHGRAREAGSSAEGASWGDEETRRGAEVAGNEGAGPGAYHRQAGDAGRIDGEGLRWRDPVPAAFEEILAAQQAQAERALARLRQMEDAIWAAAEGGDRGGDAVDAAIGAAAGQWRGAGMGSGAASRAAGCPRSDDAGPKGSQASGRRSGGKHVHETVGVQMRPAPRTSVGGSGEGGVLRLRGGAPGTEGWGWGFSRGSGAVLRLRGGADSGDGLPGGTASGDADAERVAWLGGSGVGVAAAYRYGDDEGGLTDVDETAVEEEGGEGPEEREAVLVGATGYEWMSDRNTPRVTRLSEDQWEPWDQGAGAAALEVHVEGLSEKAEPSSQAPSHAGPGPAMTVPASREGSTWVRHGAAAARGAWAHAYPRPSGLPVHRASPRRIGADPFLPLLRWVTQRPTELTVRFGLGTRPPHAFAALLTALVPEMPDEHRAYVLAAAECAGWVPAEAQPREAGTSGEGRSTSIEEISAGIDLPTFRAVVVRQARLARVAHGLTRGEERAAVARAARARLAEVGAPGLAWMFAALSDLTAGRGGAVRAPAAPLLAALLGPSEPGAPGVFGPARDACLTQPDGPGLLLAMLFHWRSIDARGGVDLFGLTRCLEPLPRAASDPFADLAPSATEPAAPEALPALDTTRGTNTSPAPSFSFEPEHPTSSVILEPISPHSGAIGAGRGGGERAGAETGPRGANHAHRPGTRGRAAAAVASPAKSALRKSPSRGAAAAMAKSADDDLAPGSTEGNQEGNRAGDADEDDGVIPHQFSHLGHAAQVALRAYYGAQPGPSAQPSSSTQPGPTSASVSAAPPPSHVFLVINNFPVESAGACEDAGGEASEEGDVCKPEDPDAGRESTSTAAADGTGRGAAEALLPTGTLPEELGAVIKQMGGAEAVMRALTRGADATAVVLGGGDVEAIEGALEAQRQAARRRQLGRWRAAGGARGARADAVLARRVARAVAAAPPRFAGDAYGAKPSSGVLREEDDGQAVHQETPSSGGEEDAEATVVSSASGEEGDRVAAARAKEAEALRTLAAAQDALRQAAREAAEAQLASVTGGVRDLEAMAARAEEGAQETWRLLAMLEEQGRRRRVEAIDAALAEIDRIKALTA